ncbi:MAG: recombinase family protein [Oligoflexales bacterium]
MRRDITKKSGDNLIAVEFYRVSGKSQEDKFSLVSQKNQGSDYAKRHDLKVVSSWSEVESASKEEGRKKFFEMLDYIKDHGIKNVIFDKVDRAVRGFKSAVMIEELVDKHGVKFHFARENLVIHADSPPQDKIRFYLGTILAKYYIDNLKQEINKGLKARFDAGHWNHKAPLGYLNHNDPNTKTATVIIDPVLSPAIKEVFELYSTSNYSYLQLIDVINRRSEKQFSWKILPDLISNPFYYGERRLKGELHGKGVHEPLISKELFDACQKIKGIRARQFKENPKKRQIEKPFVQLMKCGTCGHAITGETVKNPNGRLYVYYRCSYAPCKANKKRISERDLDRQISAAFAPFEAFTPRATKAFVDALQLQGTMSHLEEYTKTRVQELDEEYQKTRDKLGRLRELLLEEGVDRSKYEQRLARLQQQHDQIFVELQAVRKADHKTFGKTLDLIQHFTCLKDFQKLGEFLLSKAEIAKVLLSNRVLDSGTFRYDYVFQLDDLIQLTKTRVWWR